MPDTYSPGDFAARAGQELCDPAGDARLIADLQAQNAALEDALFLERVRPYHTPAERQAAQHLADALDDIPYPAGDDAVIAAHERLLGAWRRLLATPHDTPQGGQR